MSDEREQLRQDIAGAIYDATGLRGAVWSYLSDVASEHALADHVMAVIAPIMEQRDQALAAASAAEDRAFTAREDLALGDGRLAELSDMLRGMARRVGERRRDADRESKFRRASEIESYAAGGRDRESRFRWAEEAAHVTQAAKALLDMESACAPDGGRLCWSAWPPEYNDLAVAIGWRGAKRPQEYTLDDLTMTPEDRAAMAAQRDWRPATVEATPPTLADTRTGTDWCANCRSEAGTNRYRDDGGAERCATCGSELAEAPAPLADLSEPEWREFHDGALSTRSGINYGSHVGEVDAPPESANICHCPGSGTHAHVRGCRLHPEASDAQ